ncbi:MAG: hypothetical protein C0459_01320 [Chitinophaga sp.]|jgi:hypothetical protein|nr:hypothetical protein [Chitinophaga sp.]
MNYNDFVFWCVFLVLAAIIFFLDKKFYLLRDIATASPRSFSFSRVQLSWWTSIVLSALVTIMITKNVQIPDLNNSTLYLLGISSATTIGSTLIDVSDQSNPSLPPSTDNYKGQNFFLDILSDKNGVNVHRLQTVVFNLVFGIWFIINFLLRIKNPALKIDDIIPTITNNNLILLGVSSGVYTALKTTENKQITITPPAANTTVSPAVNNIQPTTPQ